MCKVCLFVCLQYQPKQVGYILCVRPASIVCVFTCGHGSNCWNQFKEILNILLSFLSHTFLLANLLIRNAAALFLCCSQAAFKRGLRENQFVFKDFVSLSLILKTCSLKTLYTASKAFRQPLKNSMNTIYKINVKILI